MIPKNVREGATAFNLDGEKAYFTIKPNGKAFRTLIDGLYSNKVRAVIRELCSNAADSHIAAGNDAQFEVTIPTTLDPTFRVRDFGTGLRHEQVMHLYTTIFESTKEETNSQTGQLGLGSKSPFAYTDTFTVIAYGGGEKRIYVAYLETDGVPSITHFSTEPSNEPTGLEVSFPAKREDISRFQSEMQFVTLGYPQPPIVHGMRVVIPTPRLKGNGWAIYPAGSFGEMSQRHFIRQGSVVYPTDQGFPHLGYGWLSIVDIPIGTAEVTASRESLSMDDDTRHAIATARENAYRELQRQVDRLMDGKKTRIEKARMYREYNGVLDNLRGSTVVSLARDVPWKDGTSKHKDPQLIQSDPAETLERAEKFGKTDRRYYGRDWVTGVEVSALDRKSVRIVINDTEIKVVRRNKRIQNFGAGKQYVMVLDETDLKRRAEGVRWLKEVLELTDDMFVKASDLPDDPPVRKPRTTAPVKRALAPGQYWMPRVNGVVESVFGPSDRGQRNWPSKMKTAANLAGITLDWDAVFWVTEKQQESMKKKGELPDNRRLDIVIRKALETKVTDTGLDQAQTLVALYRMVGEYNKALPVVMDNFFPDLKITPDNARAILKMAEFAEIDLRNRPIVSKIESELDSLARQYPLLFQRSDRSHFEHYVKAVKASAKS